MEKTRDINWSVEFEITLNGKEVNFWDLTEEEQQYILDEIFGDSYSGTFLGAENESLRC